MSDKEQTQISYRQFYNALIATVKRNLHFVILDVFILPDRFCICFAMKNKNEQNWWPKIITYYKDIRKVHIKHDLLDFKPVIVDAAAFLYIDENKIIK